jgi:hypothetical protein
LVVSLQAATVLNSLQPQLQTTAATLFQPQAASLQQVTSQPTQVTGTQVTASPLDVMSPSADMTAAGPTTLSSTMETCQPVRAHWIRFELIHSQPASKPYSLINN